MNWANLWKEVEKVSPFFINELGDGNQKIVALLATNSIEFIIIYLSVLHAGHIVMPIDPVYKKLEIDAIISRVDPAMLVLQKRYEGQVSPNKIPMKFANELLGSKDKARTKPLRLPAK
ncbi:MAG TPA: AMP-binding protein, partial [Chitinophagaceae bacterium]|nr:AMP-binding protein [Chitinophagaceae bacterium]